MELMISAEVIPAASKATEAARRLQSLGFQILATGETISVQAPKSLWTSTFAVRFEEVKRPVSGGLLEGEETHHRAIKSTLRPPADLGELIETIEFIEPPELF